MSGRNIEDLPRPPSHTDPHRHHKAEESRKGFETSAEAESEDALRIRKLRRMARSGDERLNAAKILALAERLAKALDKGRLIRTAASARYMRKVRRRLAGWLWWLASKYPEYPVAHVTLLADVWEVPADDLHLFDPVVMLKTVRSRLSAHGVYKTPGYLALGVHSEFWAPSQTIRFHLHGTVAGPMRRCVAGLRECRMFEQDQSEERERPNVQIEGVIKSLPAMCLYVLQGWWPKRGYIDVVTGEEKRGFKRRIPEPHHTQYLLWLDRYRPKDLVLLINLRAAKKGLKLIKKPTRTFG